MVTPAADDKFPANYETLSRSLSATGLDPKLVARLTSRVRHAIRLITAASDEDAIPLGASKFGGRPDLPPGSAWPKRPPYPDAARRAEQWHELDRYLAQGRKPDYTPDEYDRRRSLILSAKADAVGKEFPLAFMGQFDLASLALEEGFDTGFPKEGRLLLFYDCWQEPENYIPEASVGWRLVWDTTPASALQRAPIPAELSAVLDTESPCIFRAARISTRSVVTPIGFDDESWDDISLNDDVARDIYRQWLNRFERAVSRDGHTHQFGGFPQTLQGDLQAKSQFAANGLYCGNGDAWKTEAGKELLKSARDWRLVLQIGEDLHAGILDGAYYVVMREQDIAARRFDRARVEYQRD